MKQTDGGGGGKTDRPLSKNERRRAERARRQGLSSGRLALIVAVAGVVLVVLFILPRGQKAPSEPLPRAGVVSAVPINGVDPTSGKPIVPGIASTYKGYTIGHCCEQSKREWEALSTERKEAAIRGFLRL